MCLVTLGVSVDMSAQEHTPIDLAMAAPMADEWRAGHVPAHESRVVRIHDDGRQGDERSTTAQLVLALECAEPRTIAVDVFDEHGSIVRQQHFLARPGHRTLVMGLDGLGTGRYAARISGDVQGRVVRFRR